ncbi:MAG: SPOR domain-containing protein [Desulfovibrionaceae bacterium]
MSAANAPRRDRKTYSFSMSVMDLVWAGTGAAFALTVFFLFGVLVGRGYVPVEAPGGEAGVAVHGEGADSLGEASGEGASGEGGPAEPVAEVLKAEELGYQDQLARTGSEPAPAATAPAVAPGAVSDAAPDAAPDAGPQAQAAPESAAESTESAAPQGYDPANLPAPEPGEQRFAYVYQAAAFKDRTAAEELAARLGERGVAAEVNEGQASGSTWYRVRMPFTGTPSQTRVLRDAAEAVSGEKPVMVSKKPTQ